MSQSKTTVGALLDRYENGEIELTEMEVRSFKSLPRSTPVYGFEVKPKLKDRFAALGGPVPTEAKPAEAEQRRIDAANDVAEATVRKNAVTVNEFLAVEKLTEKETEVFEYLDALRESGETNMFGAAPYLVDEFGMEKAEAKVYLVKWMETFSTRHHDDRVTESRNAQEANLKNSARHE